MCIACGHPSVPADHVNCVTPRLEPSVEVWLRSRFLAFVPYAEALRRTRRRGVRVDTAPGWTDDDLRSLSAYVWTWGNDGFAVPMVTIMWAIQSTSARGLNLEAAAIIAPLLSMREKWPVTTERWSDEPLHAAARALLGRLRAGNHWDTPHAVDLWMQLAANVAAMEPFDQAKSLLDDAELLGRRHGRRRSLAVVMQTRGGMRDMRYSSIHKGDADGMAEMKRERESDRPLVRADLVAAAWWAFAAGTSSDNHAPVSSLQYVSEGRARELYAADLVAASHGALEAFDDAQVRLDALRDPFYGHFFGTAVPVDMEERIRKIHNGRRRAALFDDLAGMCLVAGDYPRAHAAVDAAIRAFPASEHTFESTRAGVSFAERIFQTANWETASARASQRDPAVVPPTMNNGVGAWLRQLNLDDDTFYWLQEEWQRRRTSTANGYDPSRLPPEEGPAPVRARTAEQIATMCTGAAAAAFLVDAASAWYHAGEHARMRALLDIAEPDADLPTLMRLLNLRAILMRDAGDVRPAIHTWRRVLAAAAAFRWRSLWRTVLNNVGTGLVELGHFDDAHRAYAVAQNAGSEDASLNDDRLSDFAVPLGSAIRLPSDSRNLPDEESELRRIMAMPWNARGADLVAWSSDYGAGGPLQAARDDWVAETGSSMWRARAERVDTSKLPELSAKRLQELHADLNEEPVALVRALDLMRLAMRARRRGDNAAAMEWSIESLQLIEKMSGVGPEAALYLPHRYARVFADVAEIALAQRDPRAEEILERLRTLGKPQESDSRLGRVPTYEVFPGHNRVWARYNDGMVDTGYQDVSDTSGFLDALAELQPLVSRSLTIIGRDNGGDSSVTDRILRVLAGHLLLPQLESWLRPNDPLAIVASGLARLAPWLLLPVPQSGRPLGLCAVVSQCSSLRACYVRPERTANARLGILTVLPDDDTIGLSTLPDQESTERECAVVSTDTLQFAALAGALSEYSTVVILAHGTLRMLQLPSRGFVTVPELQLTADPRSVRRAISPSDLITTDVSLAADGVVWASCHGGVSLPAQGAGLVGAPASFPDALLLMGARWVLGGVWELPVAGAVRVAERLCAVPSGTAASTAYEAVRDDLRDGTRSPSASLLGGGWCMYGSPW